MLYWQSKNSSYLLDEPIYAAGEKKLMSTWNVAGRGLSLTYRMIMSQPT